MNRKNIQIFLTLFILSLGFAGCEVAGDLVEFGVWIGAAIVIAVLALVFWIYRKFKK